MIIFSILLLAGFYVGWNIGSNDAGNCIGTSVGSGILSYKRGIIFVAVFAVLGAALQGQYVMETIGKGIVQAELPELAILVAMLSAGIFVTIATVLRLPVSTSQAIVGGVAGVGIGAFGLQSADIKFAVIKKIIMCWVLCPILTMIMAYIMYRLILFFLHKAKNQNLWNRIMGIAVIISAAYVSYTLGANHAGTAMGMLVNKYPDKFFWLTVAGGVAIALGALTFSRRVTETISKNIIPLDLAGAFTAQLAGGLGVHLFSIIGVPISTSQSIVGALAGVGLVRGINAISGRQIVQIVIGWITIPSGSAVFAFFLFKFLERIL
ncbi:MAG: inorganic phosphate transporter [Elusimicrobiota bacterium]